MCLVTDPTFIVLNRFRTDSPDFPVAARAAIAALADCTGFVDAHLGQSTDEADLRTITTRWVSVGAYRRALSSFEVKMTAIPLLSTAIDESSAYEVVHYRSPEGFVDAVTGLALDAGSIGLGEAAGPDIAAVDA